MEKKFAVARVATPILETPEFNAVFGGVDGNSLPFNEQKLLKLVSAVAFPNTKFKLLHQCSEFIFHAWSSEHRLEKLFIDSRFLEMVPEDFPERGKMLPSRETILESLHRILGVSYIWGGNWHMGIPEMKLYYPPKIDFADLDPVIQRSWTLQGVDCSGLIYQVTNGITPRATSLMVNFGDPVSIANKSQKAIINGLKPLDLIIFHGHVIIVFDEHSVIESRGSRGVILSSMEECFEQVLQGKEAVDIWDPVNPLNKYIIRRWLHYPTNELLS